MAGWRTFSQVTVVKAKPAKTVVKAYAAVAALKKPLKYHSNCR